MTHYKPNSSTKGLAVVVVDDTYEDLELHYPRLRLKVRDFELFSRSKGSWLRRSSRRSKERK